MAKKKRRSEEEENRTENFDDVVKALLSVPKKTRGKESKDSNLKKDTKDNKRDNNI